MWPWCETCLGDDESEWLAGGAISKRNVITRFRVAVFNASDLTLSFRVLILFAMDKTGSAVPPVNASRIGPCPVCVSF